MSQHPSLRVDSVGAKHRNVLKRFERIQKLEEENRWQGRASIFGLPKVKSIKIKVKKIKEAAAEGAEAPPAAAAAEAAKPAAGKPAAAAKPVAAAKPAVVAAGADKGKATSDKGRK